MIFPRMTQRNTDECPQVDYDDDNRNNIGQLCPQADGFIVRNIHEYARNYQKNIAERLMDIDGDC